MITDRSGFPPRCPRIGPLTVSVIGPRLRLEAGPGSTTSPGALRRSTTAAGSMSRGAGAGRRARFRPSWSMRQRSSPLSTRARQAMPAGIPTRPSADFRWRRGSPVRPGTTPVRPMSKGSMSSTREFMTGSAMMVAKPSARGGARRCGRPTSTINSLRLSTATPLPADMRWVIRCCGCRRLAWSGHRR